MRELDTCLIFVVFNCCFIVCVRILINFDHMFLGKFVMENFIFVFKIMLE